MKRVGGSGSVVLALCMGLCACGEPTATESDGGATDDDGATGSTSVAVDGSESSGTAQVGPAKDVVWAEEWELAPASDDPLAEERPDFVQCEIGWDVEIGAFEVSTDLCAYGTFVQSTLAEIHEGDTLELLMLHDALYAEEPASAHVAIVFGDEIAWEIEIPIPSEADQVRATWTAPADVPINSPVYLHIHNHGTNNYRFIDLTVSGS